jgi:hypothetical protein
MGQRLSARLTALGLVLALGAASATALGDVKKQAKKHFVAGMKLLNREDFAGAAAAFEKSVTLYSTKNGLFNLANCYQELRRYAEALAMFEQLENVYSDELDDEMLGAVVRHKKEILEHIAVLEIDVSMSGAIVRVDGEVVGKSPLPSNLYLEPAEVEVSVSLGGFEPETRVVNLAAGSHAIERFNLEQSAPAVAVETNVPATVHIDDRRVGETPREDPFEVTPGRHVVRVSAEGHEPVEQAVDIRQGQTRTLKLELEATAQQEPAATEAPVDTDGEPKRVWTWVAVGVAGGAAAVGVITGIAASVKTRDLLNRCDDNQCPESSRNAFEQADNLAKTTNAMIAIAAIGAAAGVTLYFVEPRLGSREEQLAVVPALAPGAGGLTIQGHF